MIASSRSSFSVSVRLRPTGWIGIVKKPSCISRVLPSLEGFPTLEGFDQRRRHAILPGAEDQRLAVAMRGADDAADEDHVVAAGDGVLDAAFEMGEALLGERAAAESRRMIDYGEFVRVRRRE